MLKVKSGAGPDTKWVGVWGRVAVMCILDLERTF